MSELIAAIVSVCLCLSLWLVPKSKAVDSAFNKIGIFASYAVFISAIIAIFVFKPSGIWGIISIAGLLVLGRLLLVEPDLKSRRDLDKP